MKNRLLIYGTFFALLLGGFYYFIFKDYDFSASTLDVINDNIKDFTFVDQNGDSITERKIEDKVYVAEYFFTTCKSICPRMNANMRRVYDVYKEEENFVILSHSCMPEVDSVALLKAYEQKMLTGNVVKQKDGSYMIEPAENIAQPKNKNWFFLTGDKTKLYDMARQGYKIDDNKPDSTQNIADQFIHTQFFALIDKQRRLRGIYDGLKEDEVQKLITDIKGLLKEKITTKRFMGGFTNNPG
ncbi:MAG: SCO family protein [Chitinophagaceae bacterium]|nr:SCO family protein [Chitinophagaceae bacterium]